MKKISALIFLCTGLSFFSCEDHENYLQGIEESDFFVEFTSNTPAQSLVEEGASVVLFIESPVSMGEELTVALLLEGTAVQGADYTLSANGLEIISAEKATLKIPHILENAKLKTDQVALTVNFLFDGIEDVDKTLKITLEGATGKSGLALAGGRGMINKQITFTIKDTPPILSFSPANVFTFENSLEPTPFSLSLNYPLPYDLSLNLGTAGALVEKEDFEFTDFSNTLIIPAGKTEVGFTVTNVEDNFLKSSADVLKIFIDSYELCKEGMNVRVETDTVQYFVEDESKLASVKVEGDTLILDEFSENGYKVFHVKLENPSSEVVHVGYNITTTPNVTHKTEYVDISNRDLKFYPGETQKELVILIREGAFSKEEDVIIGVELDPLILRSRDSEVRIDEENKRFFIKVENE